MYKKESGIETKKRYTNEKKAQSLGALSRILSWSEQLDWIETFSKGAAIYRDKKA